MNRFTLLGPVILRDGYGSMTIHLAKALLANGVDLNLCSTSSLETGDLPPELLPHLNQNRRDDCEVGIGIPPTTRIMKSPFKILCSMFEAERIPKDWVHAINLATINIVPAQWCKEVWKSNGVFDPIEVVPLGVDAENYPLADRPYRDTFTFLVSGTLQRRKNPLMVAQAFLDEFPESDVRLVFKTLPHMGLSLSVPDSRIEIIQEVWSPSQMLDLYHRCDCFVYPSSGEGFGLPPLEAMSTGLPVIVSSCTGMLEFADDRYCLPLPMFGQESNILWNAHEGSLPIPCYRSLKRLMRFAYENREYVRDLGQSASAWVQREFTWNRTASSLLRIIHDSGIIFSEE